MILVTGGAGFIGSNLVNELLKNKLPIAVCDFNTKIDKSYFKDINNILRFVEPIDLKNFIFLENNLFNKYLKGLYCNSLSLVVWLKTFILSAITIASVLIERNATLEESLSWILVTRDPLGWRKILFLLIKLSCSFFIDLNLETLSKWSNLKWPYCSMAIPIKGSKKNRCLWAVVIPVSLKTPWTKRKSRGLSWFAM